MANVSTIETTNRKTRSAVTNGSRALLGVDGRTALARRYRDLIAELTADCAGAKLSEGQRQLVRRAAHLSIQCELVESESTNGKPFDLTVYMTTVNTLRRVLASLGLKRADLPANAPQATPDQAPSARGKAAGAQEADSGNGEAERVPTLSEALAAGRTVP